MIQRIFRREILAWVVAGIAILSAVALHEALEGHDAVRRHLEPGPCPVAENVGFECDVLGNRVSDCNEGQDLERLAFGLVGQTGTRSYRLEPAGDTHLRGTVLFDPGERRAVVLVTASEMPKTDENMPLEVWVSRGDGAPKALGFVDWMGAAVGIFGIKAAELEPMPDHVFLARRGDGWSPAHVLLRSGVR